MVDEHYSSNGPAKSLGHVLVQKSSVDGAERPGSGTVEAVFVPA
jgi:hypothetical protein